MSKNAQQWRAKNHVKYLDWPSNSPDINPIENVWSVLKANVSNHKPSSAKELIHVIKNEWKKLDPIFTKNLVASMKTCISLLLSNQGDHILY
jgi:hypothetical protein